MKQPISLMYFIKNNIARVLIAGIALSSLLSIRVVAQPASEPQPQSAQPQYVLVVADEKKSSGFFEITPTFTYTKSENVTSGYGASGYTVNTERNFYGLALAGGIYLSKLHKLQLELGLLYSDKCKYNFDFGGPYGQQNVTSTETAWAFPELLTYNVCIPLGSERMRLCVGPSIGLIGTLNPDYWVDDSNGSAGFISAAAGGNVSLMIASKQKFYMSIGIRYLYVAESFAEFNAVTDEKLAAMNTLSANVSFGWKF